MKVVNHDVPPMGSNESVKCCRTMNRVTTFAAFTMGCRVNQVETERLRQGGVAHGFYPVKPGSSPDWIIINTCSVTSESDRQARQLIRRVLRENPRAQLIITGCYAQGNASSLGKIPGVALVLGNAEKGFLWEHLKNLLPVDIPEKQMGRTMEPMTAKVCVGSVANLKKMDDVPLVDHFSDRSRAFLQVQDGCDGRCTFCTIPELRGPSRSLPMAHILSQAKKYLEAGYQEIVLTGINLGSYGRDLTPSNAGAPITLALMVREISQLMTVERIRLSSLDPTDLEEALIEQFLTNPKLCPYLHISIQSGDDRILKRMGRGYGRHFVLDKVKKLRAVRPDMVFGADLIVGFPTETQEAFQKTLDLVYETKLTFLHVFRYSDRPGTPAASIPGRFRVSAQEIQQRSEKMRQAKAILFAKTAQHWIGKEVDILVETLKDNMARGKTASFLSVQCPATAGTKIGQWITLKITGFNRENVHFYGYAP